MVNIATKVFVFARQKGFFSQYVGLDRKQFLSLRLKNKMIRYQWNPFGICQEIRLVRGLCCGCGNSRRWWNHPRCVVECYAFLDVAIILFGYFWVSPVVCIGIPEICRSPE